MDYQKLMAGKYPVKQAGMGGAITGAATGVLATSWIPIPGARIVGGLIGGLIGGLSGGKTKVGPGSGAAGPMGSGGGSGGIAAKTLTNSADDPPPMNQAIGPSEKTSAHLLLGKIKVAYGTPATTPQAPQVGNTIGNVATSGLMDGKPTAPAPAPSVSKANVLAPVAPVTPAAPTAPASVAAVAAPATPVPPSADPAIKTAEYLPMLRAMEGMEKEAIIPLIMAAGRGLLMASKWIGPAARALGTKGFGAVKGLFRGGAGAAKATNALGSTASRTAGSTIQNVTQSAQRIKIPASQVTRMPAPAMPNLTPAVVPPSITPAVSAMQSPVVGQAARTKIFPTPMQGAAAPAAQGSGIGSKVLTAAMWAPMFMGGGGGGGPQGGMGRPQFMRA